MSRIFLSFIGNHDPGKAEPDADGVLRDGPLPSVIRHLHGVSPIHQAVLFYTPEYEREDGNIQPGTDIEWELTCNRIQEIDATIDIVSVPLKINPAREKEVLAGLLQWLETQPEIDGNDVAINVASGTPAMRAVWTFLVDAGLIPRASIWNSLNPGVSKEVERVYPMGLGYLDETRHIYNAAGLMRGMAFAEAANALQSISEEQVTNQRVERGRLWRTILSAYALWDRSFYQEAHDRLVQALAMPAYDSLADQVKTLLADQVTILACVAASLDHPKSLPVLFDLYASLSRRRTSRMYANIGTRARRILEGAIRYAVGQQHKDPDPSVRTTAIDVVDNKGGFYAVFNAAEGHIRKVSLIPMSGRDNVWGTNVGDFYFQSHQLYEIRNIYKRIDNDLNNSIEVHRFTTPDHVQADQFIMAARQCISVLCSGTSSTLIIEPKLLAFGSTQIETLADYIKGWI